jgi:hypothetical protein
MKSLHRVSMVAGCLSSHPVIALAVGVALVLLAPVPACVVLKYITLD